MKKDQSLASTKEPTSPRHNFWHVREHHRQLQHKIKLEGERKIVKHTFLTLCKLKLVVFGIPLVLSIVGLYLLLKDKLFRAKWLYDHSSEFQPSTTHLLAHIDDSSSELIQIQSEHYQNQKHHTFHSQLLKYEIIDDEVYPVSSEEETRLSQLLRHKDWLNSGLSTSDFLQRLSFFGGNQHKVEIPGYLSSMFQIMTEPLFLLQYFIFCVWLIQQLYLNTLANFSFCLAVNTVNYLVQYYNFTKIKSMAEKAFRVKVVREERLVEIDNAEIVPGDIYQVEDIIPCDSVVLRGDIMVNEVNFTGENLPILKCPIEDTAQLDETAHWIYEGSELLKTKEGSLAMAVHTGYTSHRGQIIRKIVKHNVKEPQFTHSILKFFIFSYLLAALIYLIYLAKLMTLPIRQDTIVFLFFQIVSLAVPVGYIGVLNFFPGMSLIRLDLNSIFGKEPYKVYESAQIKTICFDKTGTLTNNSVELAEVYLCNKDQCEHPNSQPQKLNVVKQLFATCHMVKQVHPGQLRGDEIDLKMFLKSGATMKDCSLEGVLWEVAIHEDTFEVLRVNQFESKHASMSVLVRNKSNQQAFIFAKGSPELIHTASTNPSKRVPELVKQLSFAGFRTIGLAFKQIQAHIVNDYLKCPRQLFLKNVEMLGIVSFVNKLKEQTPQAIHRLKEEVGVDVKMITGDNIYTAVQTALKAGLLTNSDTVVVCERKNILDQDNTTVKALVIEHQLGSFKEQEKVIDKLYEYIPNAPPNTVFALEGCFLEDQLFHPASLDKVKVFARVSPQNKTAIIKKMQQALQSEHSQKSTKDKLFGSSRSKVCMVGDGANDLMAIKQADVGIGLSQSDGTFSADFVISKLHQIEEIIQEGKSISQVAIETLVMFFINTWLYIPLMLLTLHDLCTFSEQAMFYKNVAFIILIPLLQGLTKPRLHNTCISPQMNVLGLQHQLTIWISNFIYAIAFSICFFIYWNGSDFETNHRGWVSMKDKFTTYSKSSTLCFKLIVAHCLAVIFNMYQNKPWKQPLTNNVWLTFWLIFNLLVGYVAFFRQQWLPFMQLAPLSNGVSEAALVVMSTAFLLNFVAVKLITHYFVLSSTSDTELSQTN